MYMDYVKRIYKDVSIVIYLDNTLSQKILKSDIDTRTNPIKGGINHRSKK